MKIVQSVLFGQSAPGGHKRFGIPEADGIVDDVKEFSVHPHVALVFEGGKQMHEVFRIIFLTGVGLFRKENVLAGIVGVPQLFVPGMIGPTEAEGEVRFARCDNFLKRALHQLLPVAEPVFVVAESLDAGLAGQFRLLFAHLGKTQVVEAQIGGNVRLFVTGKEFSCSCHIGPFCESFAPPLVVLGKRVVLREVVCEDSGFHHRYYFSCFVLYV